MQSFNVEVLMPPGISNTSNNCFASSVIHCLFNHPVFLSLSSKITEDHQLCTKCGRNGNKHYSVYNQNKNCTWNLLKLEPCFSNTIQNLFEHYKYNNTPTVLQSKLFTETLQSEKIHEIWNKANTFKIILATHQSFIPGVYQDAHEYFIQLIDKLQGLSPRSVTSLFTALLNLKSIC